MAASWLEPQVIEKWIAMGADVNATYRGYNRTALITAAASEGAGPATLQLLLDKGADVNAEDTDGERALDWAMYRRDQARIDVLERHGAKRGSGPRQQNLSAAGGNRGCADDHSDKVWPCCCRRLRWFFAAADASPVTARACRSRWRRRRGPRASKSMRNWRVITSSRFSRSTRRRRRRPCWGTRPAGRALTIGYIMMALADEHHPLDKITAPFTHLVAASQMPDGSWIDEGISRPPIEHSDISITAMAVRTLTPVSDRGAQAATGGDTPAGTHVACWRRGASSAEDRAMRLMGLVWTAAPRNTGTSQGEVQAAVRDILAEQRPDGGWSQLPQLDPDAYGTGISLYALHQAGVPSGGGAYKIVFEFLLNNQQKD